MKRIMSIGLAMVLTSSTISQDKPGEAAKMLQPAREKGLDWLTKNQAANGAWGKTHTIAVTSFACLAYLSAADEPFAGERGKALVKGLEFLMGQQKHGLFPTKGHSWIHGQGFATLALSEAYARSLRCQTKPDLDLAKIKAAVAAAVKHIEKHQSNSGGWWYTPNSPDHHEGSTTVCAVQALVSASNHGIAIDPKVLDKGFDYLKKCQTKEGGFNYQLGDGRNMKEGTAGGMATLGLMKKFDNEVMIKAHEFLQKVTPTGIPDSGFPYYGHFYGIMGMHLLCLEFGDDKEYRTKTQGYIAATQKVLIGWQQADGSYPVKGWITSHENAGYGTAFATLALFIPEARLSVYNRTPPELPKRE